MKLINSTSNFRVVQWCKLKNKAHRNKIKTFVAEGYHCVAEAFKVNCLIETISTEKIAPFNAPHHTVTYEVMEKLTAMAAPPKIIGICRVPAPRPHGEKILLIDRVHHAGNLGTIIRSAVAFGADTIILDAAIDAYNPKVVQASQGMIFHINIIMKPLQAFMLEIKNTGYQLIGTDVREGTAIRGIHVPKKYAMLIGNEGDGAGDNLLTLCDIKIHIPMDTHCESLNVGVATSIILYELAMTKSRGIEYALLENTLIDNS